MVEQLTLLAVMLAGLPVSGNVVVIAGVILAVVVVIIAFLVYRSGGSKTNIKAATGTGNNEWQRQPQQQPGNMAGNANGWNPQGQGNDVQQQWTPQQAQGQQGGWNTPANSPQQGWGTPQQTVQAQPGGMPAWANPNAQQPQPQSQQVANSPWGDQGNATQAAWGNGMQNGQQTVGAWSAGNQTAQPVSSNQWDQPRNTQEERPAWDQQPAPLAQDPWNQQPQQQWGGQQNNVTKSPQGGQGNFGAGVGSAPSWNPQGFNQNGQNGSASNWNNPQQQQQPSQQSMNSPVNGFPSASSASQAPSWQQQNAFNPGTSNAQQNQNTVMGGMNNGFNAVDNDRTIMRPANAIGLVRVEEGKEPGREYKILKDALSIGRSRESDIFLEDLAVSRLHASVVNQGNGQYALRDEGSANGTMVNGQLVGKLQVYPLQEGDRIKLGQTVLVFARG